MRVEHDVDELLVAALLLDVGDADFAGDLFERVVDLLIQFSLNVGCRIHFGGGFNCVFNLMIDFFIHA